jgi:hypothetical protein
MKTTPPVLSLLLLVTALALALLSIVMAPGISGIVIIYVSTLAILVRALVEWFRPPGNSLQGIGWGILIMVAYGFILPAWAKFYGVHSGTFPLVPAGHVLAAGLNLVVPIVKVFVERVRRNS